MKRQHFISIFTISLLMGTFTQPSLAMMPETSQNTSKSLKSCTETIKELWPSQILDILAPENGEQPKYVILNDEPNSQEWDSLIKGAHKLTTLNKDTVWDRFINTYTTLAVPETRTQMLGIMALYTSVKVTQAHPELSLKDFVLRTINTLNRRIVNFPSISLKEFSIFFLRHGMTFEEWVQKIKKLDDWVQK